MRRWKPDGYARRRVGAGGDDPVRAPRNLLVIGSTLIGGVIFNIARQRRLTRSNVSMHGHDELFTAAYFCASCPLRLDAHRLIIGDGGAAGDLHLIRLLCRHFGPG